MFLSVRYLDFINLMSYDLHGHWDGYVGHNSPLYSRNGESTAEKRLNTVSQTLYEKQSQTFNYGPTSHCV